MSYDLQLPENEINEYYDLKDRLQQQYAPDYMTAVDAAAAAGEAAPKERWTQKVPSEERCALRQALMCRLVGAINKLDQVQRDKPGHWKLWQSKLVSEHFWTSLIEAERMVGQEIDACVAEAGELEPGWHEHIFPQAVQVWRMQRQQDYERKAQKKVQEGAKKEKEKEVKRKEVEKRLEEEDKLRQERAAEKAMEKLLREEEKLAASSKGKVAGKAKASAQTAVAKVSKTRKK